MILQEIKKKNGRKIFVFARTRADGYILDSMKIHIGKKGQILQMDAEELKLGSCSFARRGKLLSCQAWENEEEVRRQSDLSKHYGTVMSRESKGINYAKEICRKLHEKLEDNYLRFIIKNFIFLKKNAEFEEDYYCLPIKTDVRDSENLKIISSKAEVPADSVQKESAPQRKEWKLWAGTAALILFLSIVLYSVFTGNPNRENTAENPSEWPQPNGNDLHIMPLSEAPEKFIFRKRDYARILSASLFPSFRMLGKEISEILKDEFWKEKFNSGKKTVNQIRYINDQDFFDSIYNLDRTEQILIFHNEIIQSGKLSIFRKAELLHKLYYENLTRILYHYSLNSFVSLSDFAEMQTDKEFLLSYLVFLLLDFPNSEISTEALLIMESIVQIQQRFASSFDSEIQGQCGQRCSDCMYFPFEKLSCKIYINYIFQNIQYKADNNRFLNLRKKILSYAIHSNKKKYVLNEIYFRKALLYLHHFSKDEEFEMFRKVFSQIEPNQNYGSFYSLKEYSKMKKILDRNQAVFVNFKNRQREWIDSRKRTSELEKIFQNTSSERNRTVSVLQENSFRTEYIKKVVEREKKLLYSKEQNKK